MILFTGEWNYDSYLILPTAEQLDGAPPIVTNSVKWAKGKLIVSNEAHCHAELVFRVGVTLAVKFSLERCNDQTAFLGEGIGLTMPTTGAIYHLSGWANIQDEINVERIEGSILAVRGSDARPEFELGGQPIGTVGYFRLSK